MTELKGSAVDIVERAYQVDTSQSEWLHSIRDAAERLFSGHIGAQAATFQIRSNGEFRALKVASEQPALEHVFTSFHSHARLDSIRQLYPTVRHRAKGCAGGT
jgi:hypothetical protein